MDQPEAPVSSPVAPVQPEAQPVPPVQPVEALEPPSSGPARAESIRRMPKPAPQGKPSEAQPPAPVFQGTGRRKESIARVRLVQGPGQIVVNDKTCEQYFPRESQRVAVRQPLLVTHQLGKFDVSVIVTGGGLVGQAGAIRLGIARALLKNDPALRAGLREAGLLTRDPRAKERKKYGQKGARKRFQWTKR